jgi:nucleoside-diphosphate-sugar epimerase
MKRKGVFITGASGFVGKNLISYLNNRYLIKEYVKGSEISINEDIVIHLAGKAHDLKNAPNPNEYYDVNTVFTKYVFDAFLASNANVFIMLSSVKAIADFVVGELTEETLPNPVTHYGKSKLFAEQYILSHDIPLGKRIYILRPCMIHGPGNKGNIVLLYNFISLGLPWPFGLFENKRSFLSVYNLCFIIDEIISRVEIKPGVYNVSDDVPISTNQLVEIISKSLNKKVKILKVNKKLINLFSRIGDVMHFSFNSESLNKITENYIVNNAKIKNALGKSLPFSSIDGLKNTICMSEKN